MEFRLVYEGPLDSQTSQGRVKEKHAIRKALHPQLKELWSQSPFLMRNFSYFLEQEQFKRGGFRFLPLVSGLQAGFCELDILFLRRDAPGNLIVSGGDIDNRIKVLFDGLRMAKSRDELGGAVPGPDEEPFYCLLEDDALITEVKITTDRLLTPLANPTQLHDVVLVIHVVTGAIDLDDR